MEGTPVACERLGSGLSPEKKSPESSERMVAADGGGAVQVAVGPATGVVMCEDRASSRQEPSAKWKPISPS